ncbi:TadE/TadG family type IV pilus assembly protein [Bradyrhizobium erythrophlei]|uniref:TadE/TadG family type IV pilus assembly protein n=1 Tax=Bradyrhizobium erythrophlei TaxID=1437360 RepID=UPI0035EABB1A
MTATHAGPITKRSRWRAFLADRKGVTAVEFALIGTPFIALLVALIQTFLVFFAQQLLETVVIQSSRMILTGQAQGQSLTQAQFANVVCSNVVTLFNCNKLMIDVQVAGSWTSANTGTPSLTFDASGNVTNSWQYNPGSPGDIVVVRVMYQWPVLLGPLGFNLSNLSNGNRLIMASTAFKNETFINS